MARKSIRVFLGLIILCFVIGFCSSLQEFTELIANSNQPSPTTVAFFPVPSNAEKQPTTFDRPSKTWSPSPNALLTLSPPFKTAMPTTQPTSDVLLSPSILPSLSPSNQESPSILSPVFTTTTPTVPPLFTLYTCLPHNQVETARLVYVVDGDTIRVRIGEEELLLRYIGIDAPENTIEVEAYGKQALARNQELLSGKSIFIIKDVSEVDRYQRLLRYVFVGAEFVNLILVKEGYARAVRYPPDTACNSLFQQAQREAQTSHLGLWGLPIASLNSSSSLNPTPSKCDPSYPTVCIPPPPPDLDCKDIPYRKFKVLPPDPHRFDLDGNGIGCER